MTDPKQASAARIRELILEAYLEENQTINSDPEREAIDRAVLAATSAVETLFQVSAGAHRPLVATTAMLALAALSVHAAELAAQAAGVTLSEIGR